MFLLIVVVFGNLGRIGSVKGTSGVVDVLWLEDYTVGAGVLLSLLHLNI